MRFNREAIERELDPQAFYRALGVFFVLLVALALSWGAAVGTSVDTRVRADSVQYIRYAWNLKYAGVYSNSNKAILGEATPEPDAFRTPGYPLLLYPFMERTPDKSFVVRVRQFQALLFVGIVAASFFLFRQFMPYWPSLLASGLTAISPHLVNATTYLLTETLFSLMVVLSLLLLTWLVRRPQAGIALVAGLLVGYGALVRPTLQYLPLVMIPFLWFSLDRNFRSRMVSVFLAGFLVVICAWGVRNLNVVGEWSDESLAVRTLLHGSYPSMMYQGNPDTYGVAYWADPNSDVEKEGYGATLAEIARKARNEPGTYLRWYLVGKPLTFWQWHLLSETGDVFVYPAEQSPYFGLLLFTASHTLMRYLHWPAVMLGVLGALAILLTPLGSWIGRERAACARVVSLTLFYFTGLHMIGAPYPRYSIPVRPELYGMAVFAVYLLYARFNSDMPPNKASGNENSLPSNV